MHYIIDGYNLFFRLTNHILPLAEKRERFIASLSHEIAAHRLNATLIFDSGMTHTDCFPTRKEQEGLEVVFSPVGLSADAYILELLDSHSSQNKMIVTSDRELAKKSTFLGAHTQTVESFLKMLINTNKKGRTRGQEAEGKQELTESKGNIARLLAIFEERLRDETPE